MPQLGLLSIGYQILLIICRLFYDCPAQIDLSKKNAGHEVEISATTTFTNQGRSKPGDPLIQTWQGQRKCSTESQPF